MHSCRQGSSDRLRFLLFAVFVVSLGESLKDNRVDAAKHFTGEDPVPLLNPEYGRTNDAEAKITAYTVEHKQILNEQGFWWLMGVVIVAVAVGVVGLEMQDTKKCEMALEADGAKDEEGIAGVKGVLQFVASVIALQVSMLLWGIAQEFVMTNKYGEMEESTPSVFFVILNNRLLCVAFTGMLLRFAGKPMSIAESMSNCPPAMTNILATWSQYGSLQYISFTLQTTAKSAKLLPVLIIGSLRGKRYTLLDYAECLVIVSGVVVFGMNVQQSNWADDLGQLHVSTGNSTLYGVMLLGVLIIADSMTPHLQDRAFQGNSELEPLQLTFAMSCFSSLLLSFALLVTWNFPVALSFYYRNPDAMLHLFVLSAASTMTQFLISYIVKHYGPVVFTLVVTTRQAVSIFVSNLLFVHPMNSLSYIAITLIFGTVCIRALRSVKSVAGYDMNDSGLPTALTPHTPHGTNFLGQTKGHGVAYLAVCAIGIHVLYGFYALSQEFLATHTFNKELFVFPLFQIAVNHTCGVVFALVTIWASNIEVWPSGAGFTMLPAGACFVSTFLQHQALYSMVFPAQTLMKTLCILPVMLVGRLLKNRSYTNLDYIEGMLITMLLAFFVSDFQRYGSFTADAGLGESSWVGILLMVGYLFMAAFLSNLEDVVYQRVQLDPVQMLLGLELISGVVAWCTLIPYGQLVDAANFLSRNPEAIMYVILQAIASASGAYTCTLTVRLFGPAVFTLIMMSRQVMSLIFSVNIFDHNLDGFSLLCLIVVAFLILTSSLRRVSLQMSLRAHGKSDHKA